ncbi:type IV pilus secretin PilQ [Hydrogenophilus thiooxidans]|uniref:type IV pilus secretin PilQ n=1 Tax=Hydrogenophilus thiooxidans TaxID=2820326 RepID=UPI002017E083|nr:type IV pilus secretin PilQ [Hydrogenophilus thiooxidans]
MRWVAGFCGLWLALSVWAAQLTGVELVEGGDGQASLLLRFDGATPQPAHFQMSGPARAIFDFVGAKNGLGRSEQRLARAGVERVYLVESGQRLRVVLVLDEPVPYALTATPEGWRIDWRRAALPTSEPVADAIATVAPARSATPAAPELALGTAEIRDVDFRRGERGEGRIVVTFSSAKVSPDLVRAGDHLEVRFPDVQLPDPLRRRSDVRDFGTPVAELRFAQKGRDAVLSVWAKGDWQPTAYQADTTFVLEIAEPPKEENDAVAALLKPKYQGERLTLDFQNVEVRALLQVLADFSGFNIIASDTVQGTITLRLKDVPWDQALDIILQAKGLDKRQNGAIIWVAPTQEIAQREQERLAAINQQVEKGVLRTESFQINYHSAAEVHQMILSGRSSRGGGGATGNAAAGQGFLSARGSATFDARSNKLFVTDVEERLAAVRALLKEIDVPPKQVVIEARIVEATTNFGREIGARLGLDDARIRSLGGGALYTIGPFNWPNRAGPTVSNTNYGSFAVSIFNRSLTRYLNLELNLAEVSGNGRIISSPKIMTANNVKARISVGDEIPYVTPGTATQTATVSFKEAALVLEVTPQLTPDGRVRMAVVVEKNRADYTRSVQGNPPILKKQITTDVIVENGGTVVLGGLFEESDQQNENKVPFLGDLPLMGNLFKNTNRTAQRTELMIFLTPRIVSDDLRLR